MSRRTLHRRFSRCSPLAAGALLVALFGALASCESKADDERCDEMESWLDGREASLSRACAVDSDCEIVFVRPDRPVAVSEGHEDAAWRRVLSEYQAQCAPIPRASGVLAPVCVERIIQVPSRDDFTRVVDESLGRACVLRGTYTVPDAGLADTAPDAGPDLPERPCECTGHAQCASGERCAECSCVPNTLCGQACAAAAECGSLAELGLGVTAGVCAENCERAVQTTPEIYTAVANCLRGQSCDSMLDCGGLIR